MNTDVKINSAEKKAEFFIGLDLGTSAVKGICLDRRGRILAEASKNTRFISPHDDWFETDPEEHYRDICAIIKELATQAPGEIAALAMAAASGNSLLTDAEGKPLGNIINWMDRRAVQEPPKKLSGLSVAEVRQVTGWPCIDTFPLAQFAWRQEHEAELYRSAGRYCMNTDWILFRLCGKWLMDHSTATTSILQDQVKGVYCRKFLDILNIPEEKLSTLAPSACLAGKLTKQALADTGLSEATQVITGCFDHPAAARAVGVIEPGQLMLSCGTSWVGFFPARDRDKILELELLCDPFTVTENGSWGAIFSVPYIGRAVDWYVDNLIAPGEKNKYKIFDELAAQAEAGAGGLKIDLRQAPAPLAAERENISRAVMESAAELLNARIKTLAAGGMEFKHAVMVGGPSKSPIWPRIVEEITNIKVTTGSQHAGAKGAAIIAGTGYLKG